MSTRVDTTSLISGAIVCGNRGLGVLGSAILAETATGDHGPGYLYNDVQVGDNAKEFMGLLLTVPSSGSLFANENGSFILTGAADGSYTATYILKVDGVTIGTATMNFTVGTVTSTIFKDCPFSYFIRSAVNKDLAVNYVIYGSVTSDSTTQYAIRSSLFKDSNQVYNIRATVNKDQTITYVIQGTTTVYSDFNFIYSILRDISPDAIKIFVVTENPPVTIYV